MGGGTAGAVCCSEMQQRAPGTTLSSSSAASDGYKRQLEHRPHWGPIELLFADRELEDEAVVGANKQGGGAKLERRDLKMYLKYCYTRTCS